jgi:methionyl-tRNA formyltransferase
MLAHLLAKGFKVKVITEDALIRRCARYYNVEIITFETMGEFDLFICCHGRKIIPNKYLIEGKFINIHPCLYKYKGHNPIKRYIKNEDTVGSVECQFMVEEVDAGEIINQQFFNTPVATSYAVFYNIAWPYYLECVDETLRRLQWN